MAELISIIVTTYNREDALDTVLRALSRQSARLLCVCTSPAESRFYHYL